jgi:hypothetical protein
VLVIFFQTKRFNRSVRSDTISRNLRTKKLPVREAGCAVLPPNRLSEKLPGLSTQLPVFRRFRTGAQQNLRAGMAARGRLEVDRVKGVRRATAFCSLRLLLFWRRR